MRLLVILILFLIRTFDPAATKDNYPLVPLSKIAQKDVWVRPRATIIGNVVYVNSKEADGDIHIKVQDGDSFVVCEIIPEMKLPNGYPKVGMKVRISGIVRWDGQHGWGELHPVTSWREIK